MTPKSLRLLADCLENNFITEEDRKRWVSDLRGFAKGVERSVMAEVPGPMKQLDDECWLNDDE